MDPCIPDLTRYNRQMPLVLPKINCNLVEIGGLDVRIREPPLQYFVDFGDLFLLLMYSTAIFSMTFLKKYRQRASHAEK